MCTAMQVKTPSGDVLFGRTMDFSYPLEPELYFVARGYRWHNILNTHVIPVRYGFMGIGQDISPVVFTDGVNEKGFAAAALYFPGYAQYDSLSDPTSRTLDIAATELVKFLLSTSDSVHQAASLLRAIHIVGVKDSVTGSIAPLHWLLADESGACMVVEKTADGLHLTDNPLGVLSNSPDFDWHLTNLRNYLFLSPHQLQHEQWGAAALSPFGQGAGAFGLPGDYTPPSRFIRTAFQKTHALFPENHDEAIMACFHVMESVSIPKGVVMTARGTSDYTQYTAFIDMAEKNYYFKTYDNSCISMVKFQQPAVTGITSVRKLLGPVTFA